jgi:hypothetical protein
LILIDDVALIIEVKAVGLTAASRRGVAVRLKTQLQTILTKAANQAQRLRERIIDDGVIRPKNGGACLDVSHIREVHTIAVGLEDLSGITTATAALVEAKILQDGQIPWTVSVHDLRLICELIDRPSDLLLYLRSRTHPKATLKYRAVDELDLFMYFLREGLVIPPDADARTDEVAGQPAAKQTQGFPGQQPVVIPGITEPIDAWYTTRRADNSEGAPKPQLAAKPGLIHMLGQILGTGAPGLWLPQPRSSKALRRSNGNSHEQRNSLPAIPGRATWIDSSLAWLTKLADSPWWWYGNASDLGKAEMRPSKASRPTSALNSKREAPIEPPGSYSIAQALPSNSSSTSRKSKARNCRQVDREREGPAGVCPPDLTSGFWLCPCQVLANTGLAKDGLDAFVSSFAWLAGTERRA